MRRQTARVLSTTPPPDNPTLKVDPLQPTPPRWVADWLERDARLQVITARVPDALSLDAAGLADAVATQYRRLVAELARQGRHAVRIWNFVPDIQAPMDGGDRYMAFNLGRFNAYTDWLGQAEGFGAILPAASAVGVGGDTLWIHVLAAETAGQPIENPRQVPAYRYSRRYGIRPPCFARATKLGSTLLIAGTASIIGEDSRHAGCIETQTRETLHNIATLIASARQPDKGSDAESLSPLIDLRVHVLDRQYAAVVQMILDDAAPEAEQVEYVEAQLCRKELLVEIEGRARL